MAGENNEIGKEIAEMRKQKGWSLERLADKCGVTSKTIQNWEAGRTEPKPLVLRGIKELLR